MQRSLNSVGMVGSGRSGVVPQRNWIRGGSRRVVVQAEGERGEGERQPWDFGRFLKTVTYFNEPPSMGEIVSNIFQQPLNALKAITGSDVEDKKTGALQVLAPRVLSGEAPSTQASSSNGVIMVSGATGGVGRRVVAELLKRGYVVRALVRDVAKGEGMLANLPVAPGGGLELVPVDIGQRQTLLTDYFVGVRGLIICSAPKTVPKGGDTPEREKYYQGIEFFDPEIVGDTPEVVDYNGVCNLMEKARESLGFRSGKVLLDASILSRAVTDWGALDDVVMGGCSLSSIGIEKSAGEDGNNGTVFRGNVTSANNGGFASVRCKNFTPVLDAGAYDGLDLRIKGNGQRFKMIVRTDTNWDGIAYCKSFDTMDGEWQSIRLPFAEFTPVFRAKTLKDGPNLDPSSLVSLQLMLSKFEYDGELNPNFELGDFSLPIASIKLYMNEPMTPRVLYISPAGVTKWNRPGLDLSKQPPPVRLNDELGGILMYKLKAEDTIRESGVPFAIVRPVSMTEEPRGAPVQFDQGDSLMGKISREDVAELVVELLGETSATDTTFEVASTLPFSEVYEPGDSPEPRDWEALIKAADLKKGVTGKTIDGVYTGKNVEKQGLDT